MENIITLYHGTIYEFDKIDVTKGKWNKDFGRGFYTSRDVRHAERLATRNKYIEEERLALRGITRTVTPLLYTYSFDLDNMVTLNVKSLSLPTGNGYGSWFLIEKVKAKTKNMNMIL